MSKADHGQISPGIRDLVIEPFDNDPHSWMVIENEVYLCATEKGKDPEFKARHYLWCQQCGVIANLCKLLPRYSVPGKPDEIFRDKPGCVVRTHPVPGLMIKNSLLHKDNER